MSRYAVVVMLPEVADEDDPGRVDFLSRELDDFDQVAALLNDLEAKVPNWRLISFCHVEDLPLLMEEPRPGETPATDGDT